MAITQPQCLLYFYYFFNIDKSIKNGIPEKKRMYEEQKCAEIDNWV